MTLEHTVSAHSFCLFLIVCLDLFCLFFNRFVLREYGLVTHYLNVNFVLRLRTITLQTTSLISCCLKSRFVILFLGVSRYFIKFALFYC